MSTLCRLCKLILPSLPLYLLSGLYLLGTGMGISSAEDWSHWRGPTGNGVIKEHSGWKNTTWKTGKLLWQRNVGIGSSTPLVIGNNVYTLGWKNNRVTLNSLSAQQGKVQWTQTFASPQYGRKSKGDKGLYSGISGSPEFDSQTGYLYALGADGDLYCWNTSKRGERVWNLNLYEKYQVKQRPNVGPQSRMHRDYGYTSTPLVYQNMLIVEVGDDEGTLMGFDKLTGKRLWKSEVNEPAGHTGGPVLIQVEGLPCLLVLGIRHLIVIRLDKSQAGKTVALYPWTTDFANNIATPAVYRNEVLITSAYNHYAMCKLKITRNGAQKIWEKKLPSGVCSPVIHQGHVYWAWRGIHCIDFKTGRKLWSGGKVGSVGSCIVTEDDRLIVWANRGDLILAETARRSPKKYQQLAIKNSLFKADVWPHVVLANGQLYCKDRQGNLKAFGVNP